MSESDEKDGGAAFPGNSWPYSGMSLRDWFAGQALAGMMAESQPWIRGVGDGETLGSRLARNAYDAADAMLEARAARKEQQP